MSSREEGYLQWDTYAFSLANRLVTVRKQRGYSQEELAHRSGLHRNAVSNLERGTSNRPPHVSDPQMSTVYRLAHALEVPPSYLLPDVDTVRLPKRSAEQVNDRAISRVEAKLHKLVPAAEAAEGASSESAVESR
ncbi:MAG: helix-turn-helix transcriptional regulator [Gordonia sp. (in: high G+C Gram-positive bacteria)]|uniref:helix-turn-helix domain-containing protein n=1 Tax=Gordonia sp. (in: high G+C Gram-positive bacteria) TaxID=84139 RepID=UPI0039E3EBD0